MALRRLAQNISGPPTKEGPHVATGTQIADVIEFPPSWLAFGISAATTAPSSTTSAASTPTIWAGTTAIRPTLDPLPPRETARKTLEYMGGVDAVLARAREDHGAGNYRWVVHVLDLVMWAFPDHGEARELSAAAHTQLGYGAENATWRNAYLSAAQELRDGVPSGTKNPRSLRDVTKGMRRAARPERAERQVERLEGGRLGVRHQLEGERYRRGLSFGADQRGPDQPRRHGLRRPTRRWSCPAPRSVDSFSGEIGLGELERGGARIAGEAGALADLAEMLDHFPPWFPVATHGMKFGEE